MVIGQVIGRTVIKNKGLLTYNPRLTVMDEAERIALEFIKFIQECEKYKQPW